MNTLSPTTRPAPTAPTNPALEENAKRAYDEDRWSRGCGNQPSLEWGNLSEMSKAFWRRWVGG